MYIHKIKITGFKSIYDTTEFNFDDIKGFWKISGAVGVGKTTIGEAIIFGLFGSVNGKNNSDLISWGLKHGLIEIWCSSKGNNLYIKRELNLYGQSPIYAEVNGEELVFVNKRDAQSQLENDYYDTTRIMVELLCIISFNNFKSIATMNTKDIKIFLDKILGFQILTKYADVCKDLMGDNYSHISSIQTQIGNITSQISKLEEINSKTNSGIPSSGYEKGIENIQKDIKELEIFIKQYKNTIKSTTNNYNAEIIKKNSELSEIITLGKNKSKEIKLIESGVCPTCGAEIDKSQLDIKIKEKEILTTSYKSKQAEIETIKDQYNTKLKDLEDQLKNFEDNLKSLRTTFIQLEERTKHSTISTEEIKKLKSTKEKYESDLENYNREDQEWNTLYRYLSTNIRQHILNSFIPILNKNIQGYAQQLQIPYIIHFDNEFKCTINMNGFDDRTIPISSLSTGQLKTVDMIIILGVLKSIISSSNINIMFLDELFSNLDADLRSKMCNVLKESTTPSQTLFIISHQDVPDEYFNGAINIDLECFGNNFQKKSKIDIARPSTPKGGL